MKHLNPEALLPGDALITTDALPFSWITRAKTWAGVKRDHFGMGLGTHTAMVCDRGDRIYYACEMRPRLRMTELSRYDNGRWSFAPHIVAVVRHPQMADDAHDGYVLREKANDLMIKMHSCGVRYGWEEIGRIAGINTKDNPDRVICSEWCRKVWEQIGIKTPWPRNDVAGKPVYATPRMWQEWAKDLIDIYPYK